MNCRARCNNKTLSHIFLFSFSSGNGTLNSIKVEDPATTIARSVDVSCIQELSLICPFLSQSLSFESLTPLSFESIFALFKRAQGLWSCRSFQKVASPRTSSTGQKVG